MTVQPAARPGVQRSNGIASRDTDMFLDARGLVKTFDQYRALDGVDLGVAEGEFVGVIGPNGSGKTTLFHCLTGVLRPTAGSIRLRGRDITGTQPWHRVRAGMARTFQTPSLFGNLSVTENLLAAGQECRGSLVSRFVSAGEEELRARAAAWLAFLDLQDQAGAKVRDLSFGQQKFVDLGMAVMGHPTLLILDEPLGGVSPAMGAALLDRIRTLHERGLTVLLIEHDMDAVMTMCSRVIVLDHGVKIADGVPSMIQTNPAVLAAYLGGEPAP